MTVQLICASHSPLMLTDVEESENGVHAQFFRELDECSAALHKFNPELVVVFGPDHFNGFFYELMPMFCIGTAAQSSKDWHLEPGPLRVPRQMALDCVRYLHTRDFDVALSYEMKVDHGIAIPLLKLTGALNRYNVLPVFINCAADPRPSFKRVRNFGAAIGEFLAGKDMRITFVGSGGLSHDPPTPRLEMSPPDVAKRLIQRAVPTQEDYDVRENRVIRAARDLVVGKGPCLPPDEQWDHNFLKSFVETKLEDFDSMTDAEIDRVAGFGAHEVRTWVAAAAASKAMGKLKTELKYYRLVPEWITGMGIVVGQA
jgi:2,3-dihydroxyphenylpropionate 1,2-dioxygenase